MRLRQQLEAELAKIDERSAKREAQAQLDRQRRYEIVAQLRRLELEPLIGITNAVKLKSHDRAKRIPDDATGTITKADRSRVHVDFGEHGRWTLSAEDVEAVSRASERRLDSDELIIPSLDENTPF